MRVLCAVDGECVFGCSRRRAGTVAATPAARILGASEALETAARYERLGADARLLREAVRGNKHEMLVAFGNMMRLAGPYSLGTRRGGGAQVRQLREQLRQLQAEKELYLQQIHYTEEQRALLQSKLNELEKSARASAASASGASAVSVSASGASARAIGAPSTPNASVASAGAIGAASAPNASASVAIAAGAAQTASAIASAAVTQIPEMEEMTKELIRVRQLVTNLEKTEKSLQATIAELRKNSGDSQSTTGTQQPAVEQKKTKRQDELRHLARSLAYYYSRVAPPLDRFDDTTRKHFPAAGFALSSWLCSFASEGSSWRVKWNDIKKAFNLKIGMKSSNMPAANAAAAGTTSAFTVTETNTASQHDKHDACRLCRLYRYIALTLFRTGSQMFFRLFIAGVQITDKNGKKITEALVQDLQEKNQNDLNQALTELENANIVSFVKRISNDKFAYTKTQADYKYTGAEPTYDFRVLASELEYASLFWNLGCFKAYFRESESKRASDKFDDALESMTGYARRERLENAVVERKAFTRHTIEPSDNPLFSKIKLVEYAFWLASLAWKLGSQAFKFSRVRTVATQAVLIQSEEGAEAYGSVAQMLLGNEKECSFMLSSLCQITSECSDDVKARVTSALSALDNSEEHSSILIFVIDYWEWSQDDASFAQFLRDIHSAVTATGIVHADATSPLVSTDNDNEDLACLVPVVCAMVRILLKPRGRQDIRTALTQRQESQAQAFGGTGCLFELNAIKSMATQPDTGRQASLKSFLGKTEFQLIGPKCTMDVRRNMVQAIIAATSTPEWCDVRSWLTNMQDSAQCASTIAVMLYADVNNLTSTAVCTSHCCCVYNACESYASLATATACVMIDDITSLLHCTQCTSCADALAANAGNERQWSQSSTCEALLKIRSQGALTLSQEAQNKACASERTFHIVSRKLSSLAVLLRTIIDTELTTATTSTTSTHTTESALSIACKAALVVINIAISPLNKPLVGRSFSVILQDYKSELTHPPQSSVVATPGAPLLPPAFGAGPPPPPPGPGKGVLLPPAGKKPIVSETKLELFRDELKYAFVDTLESAEDNTNTVTLLQSYIKSIGSPTAPLLATLPTHTTKGVATNTTVPALLALTTTGSVPSNVPSTSRAPPTPERLLADFVASLSSQSPQFSLVRAVWLLGNIKDCLQVKTDMTVHKKGFVQASQFVQPTEANHRDFCFNVADLFLRIPREHQVQDRLGRLLDMLHGVSDIDRQLANSDLNRTMVMSEVRALILGISNLEQTAHTVEVKERLSTLTTKLNELHSQWADFLQDVTSETSDALRAYFSTKEDARGGDSLESARRHFQQCAGESNNKLCIKLRELNQEIDATCTKENCAEDIKEASRKLKALLRADSGFGRLSGFV